MNRCDSPEDETEQIMVQAAKEADAAMVPAAKCIIKIDWLELISLFIVESRNWRENILSYCVLLHRDPVRARLTFHWYEPATRKRDERPSIA